ncbi:MAG: ferrochelatase [Bryobacterales bacterium]|nr:ferrochelatase [Bryobacterales bacterium]
MNEKQGSLRQAVLLLAHGAPERLEDIEAYLRYIRNGRPVPPAMVEEIRQRYAAIGGSSPLLDRTRRQAEALERELASCGWPVKVYFAMRNWHPFIREVMEKIRDDGVERLVAICLAPQYSKMSVGLYFRRTQEAKVATGARVEIVWTKSFHAHPLLVEAFAQKLAPLANRGRVLFTAHSLPERILESGEPYDAEVKTTARLVAERCGLEAWDFAYQSQGMTDEPWLGPTVESVLDRYAEAGIRSVVLAPIGFLSDHIEILYDVDVSFRDYAQRRGIELVRTESLNDSPTFIAALAAVAREKLRTV